MDKNFFENVDDLLFYNKYEKAINLLMRHLLVTEDINTDYKKAYFLVIQLLNRTNQHAISRELLDEIPFEDSSFDYLKSIRNAVDNLSDINWFLAKIIKYKLKNDDTENTLFNKAVLLRDLGQIDDALYFIKRRMDIVFKKYSKGVNSAPMKKECWSDNAKVALFDLKSIFDSIEVEFFLKGGALLGCIRENKILEHDYDIDVGVDEKFDRKLIEEAIEKSGLFLLRELKNDRTIYLTHRNGTVVDVFFHYMEGGYYKNKGMYLVWRNEPFQLTKKSFLGADFNIPFNYDKYLTETYGDWKVYKKDYNTYIDNPSATIINEREMAFYFISKITHCYLSGRDSLALRLADKYFEITKDMETYNKIKNSFGK